MKTCRRITVAAALVAAIVGCSTIRDAHEAQDAAEAKGRGDEVSAGKVLLAGASLERLVGFAMTNRPSLVASRLAVKDARLAMKTIAADAPVLSATPWTAPKLSAKGNYSESSQGTTLKDHDWKTEGDPSASVSLELLVYDFGRNRAKANEQAEKTVAAELSLVNEGYTVFDEVSEAYFNFLERRAKLEVALTNRQQYAEHLVRAEERMKAGEVNRLDVLKARLDLANAQQIVVTASNLVETTGATLMKKLGIDASRGTWETVMGLESSGMHAVKRGFARTTYGVDSAFTLARTNAPTMQVKRAQLRAASHAVDYAVSDLLPSVSVSAGISWVDPLWYFNWGASVAQTIFQGGKKVTAIDRAVVALETAATQVDVSEQTLSEELETAVANRDNSKVALESARVSVKSAKENLETVQAQYALGEASRIELSDAISSYSTAVGTSITAFYDGQRAEAKLYRLIGRYPVYNEELVKGER